MVTNMFSLFLTNPGMLRALTDKSLTKEEQQQALFMELSKNPDEAKTLIQTLVKTGIIKV